MIDIGSISEIVDTYRKYGWLLRRLLLTRSTRELLATVNFDRAPIKDSTTDAAWFSRPPAEGPIAWEIRHLGDPPFALLEHLDENDPEFEAELSEVETRFFEKVGGNKPLDNGAHR